VESSVRKRPWEVRADRQGVRVNAQPPGDHGDNLPPHERFVPPRYRRETVEGAMGVGASGCFSAPKKTPHEMGAKNGKVKIRRNVGYP